MYALLYNDGMTSVSTWQAHNTNDHGDIVGSNVIDVTTLRHAEETFGDLARQTMRDIPTDDGGASADIMRVDPERKVPYGEPLYRLTIGPRGGIRRETF